MKTLVASTVALALVLLGCKSEPSDVSEAHPIQDEYIHLHSDGGWGIDADIWIYSDDTFRVEYSGKSTESREGSKSGLYGSLLSMVDEKVGWDLTTVILEEEKSRVIQLLSREEASIERDIQLSKLRLPVMDGSHYYLTVTQPSKVMKVDFYEPATYSESCEQLVRLRAFSEMISAIHKELEQ